MTLGYSTKWPERMGELSGRKNYFVEKIWSGLLKLNHELYSDFLPADGRPDDMKGPQYYLSFVPKPHTIREDPSNRWRAGMDIHFVINNRTKNRFQFAPVIKCVSTQTIEITDISHLTFGCLHGILIDYPTSDPGCTFRLLWSIRVDGKELLEDEIIKLAINDGFDSVEDFFEYFDKDFKGKIIHWTDLKY